MKRVKIVISILLAIIILAGCTSGTDSVSNENIDIRVIVKKQNHDFWAVVEMGTEAAEREFGVNVEYTGPFNEEDIDGQIRMVEAAIEDKVDAIVLAAIDFEKLVPVAEKAKGQGIPVVIIDSNINSDKMNGFIGTDNVDAGRVLGDAMADALGTDLNIVIVSFVKGAASSNEREQGVKEAVMKYTGINIIDTLFCNSDEAIAAELTKDMIESHPETDVFVCLNAYATVGTARGIIDAGKEGEYKIVGFDSTPEEITYLENGTIELMVVQNPFSMGYLGVKYAIDAINGIRIPENTNTGAVVITRDNMYAPENQKLLFPFVD
ncbi:MAG: substrate-binding domain-containing protein [Clostridia bacterium]|nr:substrate-binding domain-containing protein [Clostridia bacterium]